MSQVNYKINNVDITDISVSKEYFLDSYENIGDDKKQSALWVTTNTLGVTNGALGLGPEWNSRQGSIPGQTVAGGTNWKKIAVNMYTSYAIKTDGTLWATGNNMFGQLGDNTTINKSSPTQIGSDTNWKQISTCSDSYEPVPDFGGNGTPRLVTTVAIKTDGTLWSWGRNLYGELGDNTTINKSSPTQIGSDTNWYKVSVGNEALAVIKTDYSLWTTGNNSFGQLGDNTTISKSSPIQIASDKTWETVSIGKEVMAAIETNGKLWVWGRNREGVLGLNFLIGFDNASKSSPTQIGTETNWKKISHGYDSVYAIKTDGTLWTWGDNAFGQLGDGSSQDKSVPTQVGNSNNWYKVSAGNYWNAGHVSAIKTDGTLWTWGLPQTFGGNLFNSLSSPTQLFSSNLKNWTDVSTSGFGFSWFLKDETVDMFGKNFLK